jgi:UDP-2,3-diacylglucosamine pyrophosphatase LpxH
MEECIPRYSRGKKHMVCEQIEFCPWFYHEPGLLWVEHGHQYDGMNSFDYFLHPYLPRSSELMLPAGSFFVRYLFNKVEQKHPFADNIKPTSAYVRKYWLSLLASPRILEHVRYFWEIIRKSNTFDTWKLKPLEKANRESVKAEALRFGIDQDRLEKLQRFWVPSFLYNESKAGNLWRFVTYSPGDVYRRTAKRIADSLGVRYVIFGHTHEADLCSLPRPDFAEYANAGTWTKIFCNSPADRLLKEEQESVFVQILKDEENRLELLKWKEELGCGERVPLFG